MQQSRKYSKDNRKRIIQTKRRHPAKKPLTIANQSNSNDEQSSSTNQNEETKQKTSADGKVASNNGTVKQNPQANGAQKNQTGKAQPNGSAKKDSMKSKSSEQPKDKRPWLTKWVFSSLRSGWTRSRKAPKVRKSTSDETGMLGKSVPAAKKPFEQKPDPKEKTPKTNVPKREITKDTAKVEPPKEKSHKKDASKVEPPEDDAAKGESPKKDAAKAEPLKDDAPKEKPPEKVTSKVENPKDDARKAKSPKKDSPKAEPPKDAPKEKPSKENTPKDVTIANSPKKDAPKKGQPNQTESKKDTKKKELPHILLTPTECVERVYKTCLQVVPSDVSSKASTTEEQPASKKPSAKVSKPLPTPNKGTQSTKQVTSSQVQTDKTPKPCQTTMQVVIPSSKDTAKQPEKSAVTPKPTMVSKSTQTDESTFAPATNDEKVKSRPEVQIQTTEGKSQSPAKTSQEKVEPPKTKSPQPAPKEAENKSTAPVQNPKEPAQSTPASSGVHTFTPKAHRSKKPAKKTDSQSPHGRESGLDIERFLKTLFEASEGEPILITTTKSDKLIKNIVDADLLKKSYEISFPRRKLSSSSDSFRQLVKEQHFMPSTRPSLQRQYAQPHHHHHLHHQRRHSRLSYLPDYWGPYDCCCCDNPSSCAVSNFEGNGEVLRYQGQECHHPQTVIDWNYNYSCIPHSISDPAPNVLYSDPKSVPAKSHLRRLQVVGKRRFHLSDASMSVDLRNILLYRQKIERSVEKYKSQRS